MTEVNVGWVDPKAPPIDLNDKRVMCPVHGEPFRPRWPSGYAHFALYSFEALVQRPEFGEECEGDKDRIGPLLDVRPICCRLVGEPLLAVYKRVQYDMRVWPSGPCDLCRLPKVDGTRFTFFDDRGRPARLRHVCLRCVAFGMERLPGR